MEMSREKKRKQRISMVTIPGCIFSGIGGAIISPIIQNIVAPPQSFTLVYNGEEMRVTADTYEDLLTENMELKEKLEQYTLEENISEKLAEIKDYWDRGELEEALSLLKNSKNISEEFEALYEDYSELYSVQLLTQADQLIAERNYDEALNKLETGKAFVSDNSKINEKIAYIEEYGPSELADMKMTGYRFCKLEDEKPVEDSVGNKYSTDNIFTINAEGKTEYGYATFYLNKKFSGIKGTIAVSDKSANREDVQLEGWIEIYKKTGDKQELIYSSDMLSRMKEPQVVPEVSLQDAEWLEIRYYTKDDYYSLAEGYHSLEVLLIDFVLFSD